MLAGAEVSPVTSLNDYLRNYLQLHGTKAMCHEGGCGACVVSVARTNPNTSEKDVLYKTTHKLTMQKVENSFGSNICRCTGYRPILDAFKSFATDVDPGLKSKIQDVEDLHKLKCLKTNGTECKEDDDWCIIENDHRSMRDIAIQSGSWFKAYTVKDVFKYLPDENLIIGAGMSLTDLMATCQRWSTQGDFGYLAEFYKHLDLVGTVGGNLALKNMHNDFPSDVFLLLETVGAVVTLIDASDKVTSVNIVFGNISPTFVTAKKTVSSLIGKVLTDDKTLQKALLSLKDELVPVDAPPEPSPECRKMIALGLFYKAVLSFSPHVNPRYKSGGSILQREVSRGTQNFDTDKTLWPLNKPVPKLEGLTQCSGEVHYACDVPTEPSAVQVAFVLSEICKGEIESIDASDAIGRFTIPSQYHYTMETQSCTVSNNSRGVTVRAATQWMDLVNVAVGNALGIEHNRT
ncbi:Aldehyde oxidase 2 [Operophtera brumata]|uniref:Aldehyde oxidase 2 n=1 Tax=Operophtera brumata TaxID=104452 RepID=A0A0L7KTZ4_OPEBR|nr:Aldehyde oxidase 2 [Operophtera brumata]